jgi:hypothetical protein
MRGGNRVREATTKKKGLHPVWRGVGCFTMVLFTVGGYLLSGALISAYRSGAFPNVPVLPLPMDDITLGPWTVPVSNVVVGPLPFTFNWTQVLVTVFLALLSYSLVALIWGALNPIQLGPTDAPPPQRKIDKSKVR